FFFQAEDGIRDFHVTGVQTCALPISRPLPLLPTGNSWVQLAFLAPCSSNGQRPGAFAPSLQCSPSRVSAMQCRCYFSSTVAPAEIGRASCRERVTIPVGGVA